MNTIVANIRNTSMGHKMLMGVQKLQPYANRVCIQFHKSLLPHKMLKGIEMLKLTVQLFVAVRK
jgi:hypothetical protein